MEDEREGGELYGNASLRPDINEAPTWGLRKGNRYGRKKMGQGKEVDVFEEWTL